MMLKSETKPSDFNFNASPILFDIKPEFICLFYLFIPTLLCLVLINVSRLQLDFLTEVKIIVF